LAFSYGWTHEEIMGLDVEDAELYIKAIDVIEAQNMLLQMKIADYPNMKNSERRKLFKTLHKQAYPDFDDLPKEIVRAEDFALALTGKK
jgi:DNA-binding phage protein